MHLLSRPRRLGSPAAALLVFLALACGGQPEAPTRVDRDTFVAVYVDLRVAALSGGAEGLTDEERRDILERHGVSEEDLLEFAQVHGPDPAYMQEVWNAVEARLEEIRSEAYAPSADTIPPAGPPTPGSGEAPPGVRVPLPDSLR